MLSKVSRSLVACNIYVSAGGHPNHRDMLLGLLGETQELCRLANNKKGGNSNAQSMALDRRVVVVHAFRDGPYDRSSFHLAGAPDLVADVGSSLAVRAIQALMSFESANNLHAVGKEPIERRHPTVGLVDHVSVLPLEEDNLSSSSSSSSCSGTNQNDIASVAGSVARSIGETLQSAEADVLYYGHAHPSGKELAAVRRDSTRFFEDNQTENSTNRSNHARIPKSSGQATVGAPHRFVENVNIRLRPNVSRKVARTLTESVRERSGRGLPFVEALTLAYGRDQYEVACNLLDPSVTSARDIENRMRDWQEEQLQQVHRQQQDGISSALVETAYRVGTTTDMCLQALREVSTEKGEMAHNQQVFKRFQENFLSG